MTQTQLNMLASWTFGATFVIATYIMAGYYFTSDEDYAAAGLLFIVVAFVLNITAIIIISYHISRNKNLKSPKSIGLLLLNIPVAFFYLWLATFLNGYYRITVVNDTSKAIHHIHLSGCDNAETSLLEPGESETFWIEIPNDCSLNISFKDHKNNYKKDVIAGYLTNGMGLVEKYHISGKDNPRY